MAVCLTLGAGMLGACSADPSDAPEFKSGMQLLTEFRCHRAEEKRIITRGVEDDFSQQGDETGRIREEIDTDRTRSIVARGNRYDQLNADRYLIDYLTVPADISDGLLVLKLRPASGSGNENDALQLGDWATEEPTFGRSLVSTTRIGLIEDDPVWTVVGNNITARLSEIPFRRADGGPNGSLKMIARADPPHSLLEFIRMGEGETDFDVIVQDDTSVDFIGVAVCVAPPNDRGLTFQFRRAWDDFPGAIVAGCALGSEFSECDPYVGDTVCEAELPLACLRPAKAPVPEHFPRRGYHTWSGGELRLTTPVSARRFETMDDADGFCREQFGGEFRVANVHEGGNPAGFAAFGKPPEGVVRAWIDIKGQPYATCWAH